MLPPVISTHLDRVLQTPVFNILLRPHATETEATMLSRTSPVCTQVEEARVATAVHTELRIYEN